jgi:hypothetical protein
LSGRPPPELQAQRYAIPSRARAVLFAFKHWLDARPWVILLGVVELLRR